MPDSDFKPKLGRIRDGGRGKSQRSASNVLEQAGKSGGRRGWSPGNTLRLGPQRGLATGALAAAGLVTPGSRRAIVKARYTKLAGGAAHLRYILRDGITRDGQPGLLYDAHGDDANARDFLDRSERDPHQFRFIISAEDSGRLADLKPVIRDLMGHMEQDLGVKLDWVAVDHFNTGHPHSHVVLRGKDANGTDLILARQYISHGIRSRVQELVTLELGPETHLERMQKLLNDVGQERMTRLDYGIRAQAEDNVLALATAYEADPTRHAMRQGRLKTLERLGLAEERHAGVWVLDGELEPKLRRLGERADTFKAMERALAAAGIERGAGQLAVFEKGDRRTPVVGRVVAVGLVDEITDRQYVVVDGVDGRVHYAELGRRPSDAAPGKDMIVSLAADRLDGRPQAATRIEVLSPGALKGQDAYVGPTWLDEVLVGRHRVTPQSTGFGGEVERGMQARAAWLVERQLAERLPDNRLQVKPTAFETLRKLEMERIGADLAQRYNVPFEVARPSVAIIGVYDRPISTPTAKLAVIRTANGVTAAPWRPSLEALRGQHVQGTMHPTRVVWGPARGLAPKPT
jgi:type IV secretory pathway VirD2 relaxase